MTKDLEGDSDSIVEFLLQKAVTMKASDIHINPEHGGFSVRLRIDGLLYPFTGFEQYRADEIVSKIKVISGIDILEKRLPQDGRLEFVHMDKTYNFRVSTTPTIFGEAVVMRMLNKETVVDNLAELGLNEEQLELVDKMINSPFGMILITGPTGSGKTTLLYSFLNKLNKPEKNILTLEDPVEFQMKNLRQMQVNEAIGWDFVKGMRAVVRQDPDIIMLGEIRDQETALMAFQAALSGRLVFSTFHTFDVPGIIIRLKEMGVPYSVIAHSLTGVITVRLAKKICQKCAVEYTPEETELKKLGINSSNCVFKKGKGCEECYKSGYFGRVGIFEIVLFDKEIKENIIQNNGGVSLGDVLEKKNISSLRQNGIKAVTDGVTTVEEIIRILGY